MVLNANEEDGESVNHLFLHCEVAKTLWNEVFDRMGITWVMPKHAVDLFACWQGFVGSQSSVAVWKMNPLCLIWCLWLERNGRCFEDRERSMGELREFFFSTLCFWAKALVGMEIFMIGFSRFLL
ncbi:hypothetical protein I3842_06G153600 [Carya illinoinensis]|uniref:Reverse transcriptase zinc-binding domain-containing protein n=1 Tax=Carya illinoinensis TaxID=32201 RepID=A0A922JLV6_CARIL|nr:hypothetical protein I3842_06G153600 [Carya illinoinensis]